VKERRTSITLKSEGKVLRTIDGPLAGIVDRAITQALVEIASEAEKKTAVSGDIGDNSIIREKIQKREWVDSNAPADFSYSKIIADAIDALEAMDMQSDGAKIVFVKQRILEERLKTGLRKTPKSRPLRA